MIEATEIASDVVAGSTALAGLMLVYLGSVGTGLATFRPEERATVRGSFQARGWFAFVGIILAILAAGCALIGKWLEQNCLASASIVLLLAALLFSAIAAFVAARDIR